MQKKYQVFISSTYKDLIEERKKIQEILLMADCIPAGMESFVATDESQFEVIKKIIDLCDYYVLILAGRYGTINPVTGLSYTEMEYDYAIAQKIPVLVFALENTISAESDKEKSEKLETFKRKAMQNRLASVCDNIMTLQISATSAIYKAKTEYERLGWVRGSKYNVNDLLEQINTLRIGRDKSIKDCQTLSDELKNVSFCEDEEQFKEQNIELIYYVQEKIIGEKKPLRRPSITYTYKRFNKECKWSEVYQFIAPYFYEKQEKQVLAEVLGKYIGNDCHHVDSDVVLLIKHQMLALNYITIQKENYYAKEYLLLTKKGINAMNKLMLRLKTSEENK
jgi:hypothetical protein